MKASFERVGDGAQQDIPVRVRIALTQVLHHLRNIVRRQTVSEAPAARNSRDILVRLDLVLVDGKAGFASARGTAPEEDMRQFTLEPRYVGEDALPGHPASQSLTRRHLTSS